MLTGKGGVLLSGHSTVSSYGILSLVRFYWANLLFLIFMKLVSYGFLPEGCHCVLQYNVEKRYAFLFCVFFFASKKHFFSFYQGTGKSWIAGGFGRIKTWTDKAQSESDQVESLVTFIKLGVKLFVICWCQKLWYSFRFGKLGVECSSLQIALSQNVLTYVATFHAYFKWNFSFTSEYVHYTVAYIWTALILKKYSCNEDTPTCGVLKQITKPLFWLFLFGLEEVH